METILKSELEGLIGKKNFWMPKQTVNLFQYIAGIEGFDKIIGEINTFNIPNIADFEIHTNGLQIRIMHNFKQYYVGIKNDDIIEITLENEEQIYQHKEKSVFGRAIIGGLVFGPVGAIIGGMSGMKGEQKKVKMPDLILSITIGKDSNNISRVILFSTKFKNKTKAQDFFKKYYSQKFKLS